jgi:ribosome-binding ATPase
MGFNCGIIGLPNVGKSTIFNALTQAGAQAENYPFCTIEPNTGIVPLADTRLDTLAEISKSTRIIPTTVEFVDIAGLVQGASKGQGLGNQFLGHIRSVDAVVHVVRCFDDDNIVHVHDSVSPSRDVEIIETELLLADLAMAENRINRVSRASKGGDKALKRELEMLNIAHKCLAEGKALRELKHEANELSHLGFITMKPVLFVGNVSEEDLSKNIQGNTTPYVSELSQLASARDASLIVICGAIEEEIATIASAEERKLFLAELGLVSSGLELLAREGYKLLDLITFFTSGPKETRAWTCSNGTKAPQAAGKIHTDFERGFIRAEIISFDDFLACKGEVGAKERGKMRVEGKDYVVRDGDVIHFRFNV